MFVLTSEVSTFICCKTAYFRELLRIGYKKARDKFPSYKQKEEDFTDNNARRANVVIYFEFNIPVHT